MSQNIHQDDCIHFQLGDKNAFDLFYENHWEIVFDTAYLLSKDKEFAMDITQDVFLSIWERKEKLVLKNIQGYLKTAARNKFLTWVKTKNRNMTITDLIINNYPCETTSDHPLLLKELLIAYERVLDSFPSSQQKIFRMRYEQGLSTKEISTQLDITQKTVQNQIGRSLLTLKKTFPSFFYVILLFLK